MSEINTKIHLEILKICIPAILTQFVQIGTSTLNIIFISHSTDASPAIIAAVGLGNMT